MVTPPHLIAISSSKRDAWERFLFAIIIVNAWNEACFAHLVGSLDLFWGFHRQATCLLERLDRFYVSGWALWRGGMVCIWPGTVLADHAPVSLRILALQAFGALAEVVGFLILAYCSLVWLIVSVLFGRVIPVRARIRASASYVYFRF